MHSQDCQFKVVRTNGGDEALARANLLTGRSAFETAKRMHPGDVIEPSPNSPLSSPATVDAAASPRRHVLPKDLPGAIKQLYDQELDRLLAAVLAEQKRRGRKPPVPVEPPDKPRIEATAVHLTPGKMNAVCAASKAGVKPSQITRQFGRSQSDVWEALASDASRRGSERDLRAGQHNQSGHCSSNAGSDTPADNLALAGCLTKRPASFGSLLAATHEIFLLRRAEAFLLRR